MSSIGLDHLRKENPGLSDKQIAEKMADQYGYVVVVRYKSRGSDEYNNLATCSIEAEVDSVMSSPYCNDIEILVDKRSQVPRITADLILMNSCGKCGKKTTKESLTLMAGNDFYCCPQCTAMFCESCYPTLPLTGGHEGYGMCPQCDKEVIRALPGSYGR